MFSKTWTLFSGLIKIWPFPTFNMLDGNILVFFSPGFSVTSYLLLSKFNTTTLNSACVVFDVRVEAIEWWRKGSWHLTWRLSDMWSKVRSASVCHPSRPLMSWAAGKGPVNCLQMCLDACFTDKQEAGATVWWYHWSLLICISLAERAVTLQSGLVCLVSDAQANWLWPMTGYFNLLIAHILS